MKHIKNFTDSLLEKKDIEKLRAKLGISDPMIDAEKKLEELRHKDLDPRIIAHNIHHNPKDFSESEILAYLLYFQGK